MAELEQHHIRYEEIHGEDEIILLTHEEHVKVHKEDHANGFKPIPKWISDAAQSRSPGAKKWRDEYWNSEHGQQVRREYAQSAAGRLAQRKYDGKRDQTAERKTSKKASDAKLYLKKKNEG